MNRCILLDFVNNCQSLEVFKGFEFIKCLDIIWVMVNPELNVLNNALLAKVRAVAPAFRAKFFTMPSSNIRIWGNRPNISIESIEPRILEMVGLSLKSDRRNAAMLSLSIHYETKSSESYYDLLIKRNRPPLLLTRPDNLFDDYEGSISNDQLYPTDRWFRNQYKKGEGICPFYWAYPGDLESFSTFLRRAIEIKAASSLRMVSDTNVHWGFK